MGILPGADDHKVDFGIFKHLAVILSHIIRSVTLFMCGEDLRIEIGDGSDLDLIHA